MIFFGVILAGHGIRRWVVLPSYFEVFCQHYFMGADVCTVPHARTPSSVQVCHAFFLFLHTTEFPLRYLTYFEVLPCAGM